MAVLLFAAMVCSASRSYGQDATVSKLAQALTDSLGYLSLTDQQKPQALALNTTAAGSLAELTQKAKADTTLQGKALAKQVIGIMKTRNSGLKKILTPDQTKLFQQHQLQQLAELQTQMMKAQLNLTDEQVPQVYAVNLKSTQKLAADMAKTKEAKGKLKKAKGAKGMKSDMSEKDDEMKKILTSDQFAIYQKHQQEMQAEIKSKMKAAKDAKS
jgi:hypothetical protein